jgi:hypothetical protein
MRSRPKSLPQVIRLMLVVAASFLTAEAQPQADFQIVWVVIGDAASAVSEAEPRAGRQLFMAPDLVLLSLQDVEISRVEVEPAVSALNVASLLCVTDLRIHAFAPDESQVAGAPLSISIRQDQKQRLALERTADDICFRPTEAGEYTIRMTSLLPAPDGTMRGAQIFLRVALSP